GRDGLEAECCLFYTGADFLTWRTLQAELPLPAHKIAIQVLEGIENFCTGVNCRHRAILEYFGQRLDAENCQACDVCLGEISLVALTPEGRRLLRGELTPRLLKPAEARKKESKLSVASWEGVDRGLFEALRALRRRKAEERGIAPFIIFSDATLRGLSAQRPS